MKKILIYITLTKKNYVPIHCIDYLWFYIPIYEIEFTYYNFENGTFIGIEYDVEEKLSNIGINIEYV